MKYNWSIFFIRRNRVHIHWLQLTWVRRHVLWGVTSTTSQCASYGHYGRSWWFQFPTRLLNGDGTLDRRSIFYSIRWHRRRSLCWSQAISAVFHHKSDMGSLGALGYLHIIGLRLIVLTSNRSMIVHHYDPYPWTQSKLRSVLALFVCIIWPHRCD